MDTMMHLPVPQGQHNSGYTVKPYDYDPDSAHTVEVLREVNENGELGSFGFTLNDEKPPIVGTVVPGGPADRAGLKPQEVVIAVNALDTTNLSHQEVVGIISNTKTAGVWLTVCDPSEQSNVVVGRLQKTQPAIPRAVNDRLRFTRVSSLGSFSSTPSISRNMTDMKYSKDDSPPRYQDLHNNNNHPPPPRQTAGSRMGGIGSSAFTSSAMVLGKGHAPLQKKQIPQTNGYSPNPGQRQPLQQRSSVPLNGYLPSEGKGDSSLMALTQKSSPTPAAASNFTSASVLVLYIGPVEIPDAWSKRELSSKCLQECTRNLLSQRQEFVEAFLEVTLTSMRILAVSQTVIFKHKREELYYAGVCTDDELYFGIVTRKVDHKSNKKSLSGSNLAKMNRAHMCHVFKVIEHKSVLMLHSGVPKESKMTKNNKQMSQQPRQKTVPILSSVTIVNAIQGLFMSPASAPGTKILDDVVGGVSSSGKLSSGSAENVLSNGSQDKAKKKKLDVVDLRPSAHNPLPSSSSASTGLIGSGLNSITQTTSNMYVSSPYSGSSLPNSRNNSTMMINHNRSQSNPANTSSAPGMPPPDYPVSIGTPIFHQRAGGHGGSSGSGGGGSGGLGGGGMAGVSSSGGGTSWYASDSPKEEHHSRTASWDAKGTPPQGRRSGGRSPMAGAYDRNNGGYYQHDSPGSLGRRRGMPGGVSSRKGSGQTSLPYDKIRRFSDDSSVSSSLSDSRASSPTRISHRSSFTSHSRSPSPHRSLSFSSRSRTPSPVMRSTHQRGGGRSGGHTHGNKSSAGSSRMSSSTRKARMEVAMSIRAASRASAMVPSPMPLRRQGSENSIMELQELKNAASGGGLVIGPMMNPAARGTPVGSGLPPKNGPLSSSIGSIATTIVDQAEDDLEECGRVAGWVASFDKLLADPLGIHTLTLFLKKEHCEENILFWKDAKDFKDTAATSKNLPASVKKIYDEYLAPTSPNTVNIDDRAMKSIESRMATPPPEIFNEACEQIYQLMKMDCYPRFKKSALVKDCLMAEMEGKPLPIDLPQPQQQQQEQASHAFPGIWKKHREFGFGSLFGRFSRGRPHQDPPQSAGPPVPNDVGIWGASVEIKAPSSGTASTSSTPENKDKKKKEKTTKDGSPRLRKTYSAKETKSKRKSAAPGGSGGASAGGSESKAQSTTSSSSRDSGSVPVSQEVSPEDVNVTRRGKCPQTLKKPGNANPGKPTSSQKHLNIFQAHKRNVFEVNLPNKVTKIMEVPSSGTVEQAIHPVLKKHGYSLDIMELRFANNLKIIDLNSPASILVGEHISVIKSKNTFIASFPDVLERILPADGRRTLGELFIGVMREMGKLQNFSVAVEGARVGLDFETDTSALVGQRVVVKYLPGPLIYRDENILEQEEDSLKPSTGRNDMDDLFSMIARLSGDKLDDQSVSPTPPTPEQSGDEQGKRPLSGEPGYSPGETRKRSQTQGRASGGRSGRSNHRPLTSSKSTDSIDSPNGAVHYQQNSHSSRDRQAGRNAHHAHGSSSHLRPPPAAVNSSSSSDSAQFSRTQSGSSVNSGRNSSHGSSTSPISTSGVGSHHRSLSPPGSSYDSSSYPARAGGTISPPPPTSKPPPLPSHVKKYSGSRNMQQQMSRWSFRSTDSASSEDSLTADIPTHPKQHGSSGSSHHHYGGRDHHSRANPDHGGQGNFPRDQGSTAHYHHHHHQQQPQPQIRQPNSSSGYQSTDYPHHSLDNMVQEAYRNIPSGGQPSADSTGRGAGGNEHQPIARKSSYTGQQQSGRAADCSTASHPLQTSVSKGHSQSVGGSLSSHHQQHPRRSVHTLPNQQQKVAASAQQVKRPSVPRTEAQRQRAMENPHLIKAGEQLVRQEIDQYRKNNNPKPGRSMDVRQHESPETFV